MRPFDALTKELQVISSNLYMGIVSRLAEPEARKIIFNKQEEKATGVGSSHTAGVGSTHVTASTGTPEPLEVVPAARLAKSLTFSVGKPRFSRHCSIS